RRAGAGGDRSCRALPRRARGRSKGLGRRRQSDRRARHLGRVRRRTPRVMRVAYYSPLPPSRSGIADYSALLLPALPERIEVALARPGRFRRAPRGDVTLYHVGNDAKAHGWIVEALRRRPGVVVLHEFVLHHLVVGLTFSRGDAAGYRAAVEREAGLVGYLLAHAVLDNKIRPLWETRPEDCPLAGEILDRATGLVVHSRFVEGRARAAGYA